MRQFRHLLAGDARGAECKSCGRWMRMVSMHLWRTLPNSAQCKLCYRSARGHVAATGEQIIAVEIMLEGLARVWAA